MRDLCGAALEAGLNPQQMLAEAMAVGELWAWVHLRLPNKSTTYLQAEVVTASGLSIKRFLQHHARLSAKCFLMQPTGYWSIVVCNAFSNDALLPRYDGPA